MFNVIRKNGTVIKATVETREEAEKIFNAMGPQRNFFKIEEVVSEEAGSPSAEDKVSVKDVSDEVFADAVQITRANVKFFYKKAGLIRVLSPNGKILHTGKTRNMGKVFSNYVNCAKYNQSYDFDIEGGDRLLFKETVL